VERSNSSYKPLIPPVAPQDLIRVDSSVVSIGRGSSFETGRPLVCRPFCPRDAKERDSVAGESQANLRGLAVRPESSNVCGTRRGAGHMKNSIQRGDIKGLAAALEVVSALDAEELDARWKAVYGSDPPDRLRRHLLVQALAYRLQEQAFGGLKPATRRLMRSVAGDAAERRPIAVEPKRPVKAGAVLIREWHGTKHQVTALKDGFMFQGKRFQSLSRIASEITGARWSGPLFFGLKDLHQERQDGAR
jgi:Protein of unknown function (DUF2924)